MAQVPTLPFHPSETVLFPGMVHVTEVPPSARAIVEQCYREESPMAVVYARHGRIPQRWPRVGTAGYVTQVEEVDTDVLKCAIIGGERIWVEGVRAHGEYPHAYIAPFPLEETEHDMLHTLTADVRRRLLTYLGLLEAIQGEPLTRQNIPEAPLAVAFFTAIAVQLPGNIKEFLLAIPSLRQLLLTEIEMLRHEIALLEEMAERYRKNAMPELIDTPLGAVSLN
ncbi:LON peptidase substrate-binding domain-containing protein [Ardenticatena maritima]|uniref:Lon N-terminal domain-containing protein n=1 Tax=Ardenticatena maritima TaxID=872965 RepID=A0A0P6XY93_9CHLR|nr:LON peptidase substrate-binding domain-containing protein [Ardenticatena maritima]KPL89563.1 hypothetical protein SE16_03865 [Ardenticatena maritima]